MNRKRTLGILFLIITIILCNGCRATKKVEEESNLSKDNRGFLKETNIQNRLIPEEYIALTNQIIIEEKISPKETEHYWDISEKQDGSVMAYLEKNEDGFYTLYLQSNGGIIANKNSSYLFNSYEEVERIEGLEYLDTSHVTNMSNMFSYCRNLIELDLRNFNTSQVTDMSSMFSECDHLSHLDVSSFDTNQVETMSLMFSGCKRLIELDLSSFVTSKLNNVSSMFSRCSGLKMLDLRNFDISNVPDKLGNTMDMFILVPSIEIYVKDEETKQFILKKNSESNVIIK